MVGENYTKISILWSFYIYGIRHFYQTLENFPDIHENKETISVVTLKQGSQTKKNKYFEKE